MLAPKEEKKMNHSEKVKAAQKIHERARYLRGRFLNSVACIERDIALLLVEYFCTQDESKQEIFFNKIVSSLSLEKKKQVLIEIVKKDYPRYWEDHKPFLNDITDIQKLRNKLAHSIVDVTENALERPIEEGVGFIQWDNGHPITDEVFEDFVVRANMTSSTLSDIKRLLPFKEKPIA